MPKMFPGAWMFPTRIPIPYHCCILASVITIDLVGAGWDRVPPILSTGDIGHPVIGSLKTQPRWTRVFKYLPHIKNDHHPIGITTGDISRGDRSIRLDAGWSRLPVPTSARDGWSAIGGSLELQIWRTCVGEGISVLIQAAKSVWVIAAGRLLSQGHGYHGNCREKQVSPNHAYFWTVFDIKSRSAISFWTTRKVTTFGFLLYLSIRNPNLEDKFSCTGSHIWHEGNIHKAIVSFCS